METINTAILESIAKTICKRIEECDECPLSDGKFCTGSWEITKDIIDMVQQWENEAVESLNK